MNEFKTVSLADQVFEKLENDIIIGVYAKGEILTELKLVEQLGVSRTPIREALRRLQQERLVEDTVKGTVVLGITSKDLLDIMTIREKIEGLAAFYTAEHLNETGKENLEQISALQDFYYTKKDVEHLRQIDDRFHEMIYELSNRPVLRDMLVPLHRKTQRYRKVSIEDPKRLEKSIAEHKAIFDAIVAGQAELAQELMTKHIQNAKDNMIARFQTNE